MLFIRLQSPRRLTNLRLLLKFPNYSCVSYRLLHVNKFETVHEKHHPVVWLTLLWRTPQPTTAATVVTTVQTITERAG